MKLPTTLFIMSLLVAAALAFGLYLAMKRVRQQSYSNNLNVIDLYDSSEIPPQKLAALSPPFRELIAEAVDAQRYVHKVVQDAPTSLQSSLLEINAAMNRLMARALPRAEHGSRLAAYLLKSAKDEKHYIETEQAAKNIEQELRDFVSKIKDVRSRVLQIIDKSHSLNFDQELSKDLDATLFEVEALEQALKEF